MITRPAKIKASHGVLMFMDSVSSLVHDSSRRIVPVHLKIFTCPDSQIGCVCVYRIVQTVLEF